MNSPAQWVLRDNQGNRIGAFEETLKYYFRSAGPPNIPALKPPPKVLFDRDQLQHAYKHAHQFGVHGNRNNQSLKEFEKAVRAHLGAPGIVVIPGTTRWNQSVTHYYSPQTGLNVMIDQQGKFVSGWRLSDRQLQDLLSNANVW